MLSHFEDDVGQKSDILGCQRASQVFAKKKKKQGQACSTMSLLQMGADSLVHLSLIVLPKPAFLIYFFDKSFPASQTAEGLIQLH